MCFDYQLMLRSGSIPGNRDGSPRPALFNVPRAVVELVPESVARENRVFPLAFDGWRRSWS